MYLWCTSVVEVLRSGEGRVYGDHAPTSKVERLFSIDPPLNKRMTDSNGSTRTNRL